MTQPVHVLVLGALDGGACATYRFGMHQEALAEQGVELRGLTTYRMTVASSASGPLEEVLARDDLTVDRSELDWADVIVLRRFYLTSWACRDCALVSPHEGEVRRHSATTGHEVLEPDPLIRPLFFALERYPELLRGRALVYETDDDLFDVQSWNGQSRRIAPELDMIEAMVRRADLVTVATPILAQRHSRFNDSIRVIRNAIEPSWYVADQTSSPVEGDPRLLYYGSAARMRDYAVTGSGPGGRG